MLGAGILLVVVLLLLTPEGSEAATITVDDDGPADYSKIQDAINASIDGDTVFVYSGTYYEHVMVDKSIDLIGEDRGNTTIDGSGSGNVVNITKDWVNVTGFTITNSGTDGMDAGIELNNVQNCRVFNNNVSKNRNGIHLSSSSNNTIASNTVSSNYLLTGIYLSSSSNNTIIWNNVSNKHRGVELTSSSNNTITSNDVSNNHYGINLFKSSNNTITYNNVSNNVCGIELLSSSNSNLITCNNVLNNEYSINISDIYFPPPMSNNKVYHNNLIGNVNQAYDDTNNGCQWDNGYPSGGNYWDDYIGVDSFSGPNQDIPGNDGIGDTNYPIKFNGQDNYPLMSWANETRTAHNYDGSWHNSNFTITLITYGGEGGINHTYYRINNGSLKEIAIDGQPYITTESDNNTLEYWSVDNASNEETHRFLYSIKLDKTPPSTSDDYDSLWHNANFNITISTIDEFSGVNETYYRLNGGPIKMVSVDGHPFITTENDNNTLEYWSTDNASNEETHKFLYKIKLDKTTPSTSDDYDDLWHNYDFTIRLIAFDEKSGVNETYYRINGGPIKKVSIDGHPFITTEDDNNTLEYWSIDNASNNESNKFLHSIKLDKTPPSTSDDYNSLWHNADFTLTITTFEEISGVNETYYRINGGPLKMVSTDGHPFITTESDNNTLEYWSIDNASNEETHKFLYNIKLDKTLPSTSDDYNDLWHNHDFTIKLISIDEKSGVNETYYRINDGPIKMVSVDGQPFITTENDNNTLKYWSIDNASNEETHKFLYNIKLDKTAPSTLDDYDDLWHYFDFMINLTASDELSGINGTYYRINNGPLKEVAIDGQPYITTESDNNTLEYWSVDNVNNEETHRFLYCIKLDKTPPSTSDNYDSLWHNADFTITITTFEEISGVNETYYRLNGGSIKMVSVDGHPFITTEGDNNTVEYWSIDNASNEETHKFLYNIKLDKTTPSTSDDYDDLWHNYDFTIKLIAFDEESGVNETYYRIKGGPIKMVSVDGHPFITTENDNNTLEYWSIDNASNEESHKFLYNIKLDKTAPSTLDDYDDLWHYYDFMINLTASDELSGINDTFYRINNDNIKSVTDDGQPLITTEGENNILEYWSTDMAGNIEEYHIVYGIKLNKTYPDFMISPEDITFSGPRLIEASEVYLNATIHNIGNLSASATIKFYDGDPNIGPLIGSTTISVAAHDSNLASVLWTTTVGNHNIYVLIENSIPEEPFTGNNVANKSVIVEVPPVLVLSVGDINVFRFESGEERTVPVYVSSYNNSAINVRLVVLDDRGLNITVVTPPQNISKDGSFTFYLRIKAPVLKENQEYREEDILIQVISDETTSNEEFMDIIVGRAAAELFWWFVLIGGATTGAGALGFVGGTEIGKYALFAAAMSLYTRLTRKDIEDQETRGMIRGYILANPGEHYNAIKRALGLKNGNLSYHMKKLEKENLIKSTRDGRYKRFYPPSMKIPEDVFTLNKIQEIILGEIIKTPGISQKGLSETVGLSTSTINYHIGVMTNSGFVRIERKGKHTMCYPGNGVA